MGLWGCGQWEFAAAGVWAAGNRDKVLGKCTGQQGEPVDQFLSRCPRPGRTSVPECRLTHTGGPETFQWGVSMPRVQRETPWLPALVFPVHRPSTLLLANTGSGLQTPQTQPTLLPCPAWRHLLQKHIPEMFFLWPLDITFGRGKGRARRMWCL